MSSSHDGHSTHTGALSRTIYPVYDPRTGRCFYITAPRPNLGLGQGFSWSDTQGYYPSQTGTWESNQSSSRGTVESLQYTPSTHLLQPMVQHDTSAVNGSYSAVAMPGIAQQASTPWSNESIGANSNGARTAAIPSSRVYTTELAQYPYSRGQIITGSRLPAVPFNHFSLRDALQCDFNALTDPNKPAWPDDCHMPQKLAIVFCFQGYGVHTHQVTLCYGGKPPARSKLAHTVADQLQTFTRNAQADNRPLTFNGRAITLDDLVLVKVEQASKGSLQPVIAVIQRI
ncbi:hypothetical protein C8Q76DRAFT_26508 [Earliella scabrosa]|nr:hypothetical protein C8Q76DRAFT_26508 [Earliella scabrosa]